MSIRSAFTRRTMLAAAVLAASLSGLGTGSALAAGDDAPMPIVFVHGNGDTPAAWMVTMWRWETNGWPRDRLFAANLPYPTAPFMEDLPQPGTSTTVDQERALSAFVDDVLKQTGAKKIALVGNSRGANTIRNYVKNGGGAKSVSHVVLGGGVNHGAYNWGKLIDSSEFNGGGRFMSQLNAGPDEVVDGVKFLTMRSDRFDKYAQLNGRFLVNDKTLPTFIDFDAPALKGAKNLVFPGADHRESAMSAKAFAAAYDFISGDAPKQDRIDKEGGARLDGIVTGLTAGLYDNRPVKGATVRIFKVDPDTGDRKGRAVRSVTTGADGRWGPFQANSAVSYEFEVTVDGQPVTHIYRAPFQRGSNFVYLRPAEVVERPGDGSVVVLSRPSGYFGIQDTVLFDGERPAFSDDEVPNIVAITVRTPFKKAAHVARFRQQEIALGNWPAGHVAIAEFND